ncbi:MAG: DUF1800 domain-containing protein, partial [Kiritimatiellae bacterium]|nr:DUF1800 domain-containing protein [Kiritimatiellia bacterium]
SAPFPEWFTRKDADNRFPNGLSRREFQALPNDQKQSLRQEFNKINRKQLDEGRNGWLERMVTTTFPLQEKLTLFLHGHFATSAQKVQAAYPMLAQNQLFREKGFGRWIDLLESVSKDPAMLVYLDNARSSKRSPNENYAREVMELFTLGEGHYREEDIQNAARAFAGWSLHDSHWAFTLREPWVDHGFKRFMGQSGRFDGRDILDLILEQPQASRFLAERLWSFFASETPNESVIRVLGNHLAQSGYDLHSALKVLFLHRDFYDPAVIRSQIKSPVHLTVHLVRTLHPAFSGFKQINKACEQLGQRLFQPPSVKGWDGGTSWITASSLALRYQFSDRLLNQKGTVDLNHLLPDRSINRIQAREHLVDRFFHHPLRERDQEAFDRMLETFPPPSDWTRGNAIHIISSLTRHPQFQLT